LNSNPQNQVQVQVQDQNQDGDENENEMKKAKNEILNQTLKKMDQNNSGFFFICFLFFLP